MKRAAGKTGGEENNIRGALGISVGSTTLASSGQKDGAAVVERPPKKMRRFFGSVDLDPKRVGRDAGSIAEEVIQHLELERGADVKVTIEITANIPEGAGERTI